MAMQLENGYSKGIVITTAIAFLLWMGDEDSISWFVPIQGWKAWVFLLGAHVFFVTSYWAQKGKVLDIDSLKKRKAASGKWQNGTKSLSARVDVYLETLLVGIAAWVGYGIIIIHILLITWPKIIELITAS